MKQLQFVMHFRYLLLSLVILLVMATDANGSQTTTQDEAVRIGVVGLVHTHVHWILGREDRGERLG